MGLMIWPFSSENHAEFTNTGRGLNDSKANLSLRLTRCYPSVGIG